MKIDLLSIFMRQQMPWNLIRSEKVGNIYIHTSTVYLFHFFYHYFEDNSFIISRGLPSFSEKTICRSDDFIYFSCGGSR